MEQCIICFEEYTENNIPIILNCNHKLCLICYEKILDTRHNVLCPICRSNIEKEIIINLPHINVRTINEDTTIRWNIILFSITVIFVIILCLILQRGLF